MRLDLDAVEKSFDDANSDEYGYAMKAMGNAYAVLEELREAREVIKQVGDAVQSPSRGMYHSFHSMVEAVRNIIKESNHGNKREK
jgi:hypothetical protein